MPRTAALLNLPHAPALSDSHAQSSIPCTYTFPPHLKGCRTFHSHGHEEPLHNWIIAFAGLTPRDIDILVVNCSLFNPTPSLSAMVVNHFKMRGDVISYNLAGMGCSAGVIAIGLAERLLRTEPGKYALVVSTENITQVTPAALSCLFMLQRCSIQGLRVLSTRAEKVGWTDRGRGEKLDP